MYWPILTAIRDRLAADDSLAVYVAGRYPEQPTIHFFLGAKLRPTADEFPYVAVAPLMEDKEERPSIRRTCRVAIQYGVQDDSIVDGINRGLESVCRIGELIMACLANPHAITVDPTGVWTGEARTASDAGVSHPYYEAEIVLTIAVRG